MTVLDELIQELCPEGVAYKTLGEIATDVFRGAGITRDQVRETGTPCVRYGEIYTTYGVWLEDCVSHTDETLLTSKKYFDYGDILFAITGESVEDIAKCCAYIGHETCLAGGDIVVLKHNEDPQYLSYALSTLDAQKQKSKGKVKSKVVHSSVPDIKAIRVPVPPLPVQREIVRILDNFTELTAELTAELTVRKKQYAYYRDKLLTHSSETKICKLADVCESIADGDHMPPPKADDGIPFITISNITEQNKINFSNTMFVPSSYYDALADKRKPHSGDILYTVVGSYGIPVCIEQDTKFVFQRHIAILRPRSEVIKARYMFHAMQSGAFKAQADKAAKGAAQKTIGLSSLAEMTLPVPDMCIQERLIRVLDRFDTLCTDLSSGLPAEIEARQKQYEYYRDKLLEFEK